MTNYERLIGDKKYLVELLSRDVPFWNYINAWRCPNRCPHAKQCRESGQDCIDECTTEDLILLWLEDEYKGELT